MSDLESHSDQLHTVLAHVQRTLSADLRAFYLHGSSVTGGLQPQSDLDLLAVVDAPLSDAQRRDLIAALLSVSVPHPATPAARGASS